jgi:hypothetical protein
MAYRNFESNLRILNIFMKSDGIKNSENTYTSGFDDDFPYDLVSRPYYVDSIVLKLDRSPSNDFDSE